MNHAVREAAKRYLDTLVQENILPGHTFETCADLDLHQIAEDLTAMLTAFDFRVDACVDHLTRWGGMPKDRRLAGQIRRHREAFHAEIGSSVEALKGITRAMPSGAERVRAEQAREAS